MTDTIEAVANAIKVSTGCGLTLDDEERTYVLCTDPRLPDDYRRTQCDCLDAATAAIAAYRESVASEAVARRWRWKDEEEWAEADLYQAHQNESDLIICEPLFAAPPVPQPRETLQERVHPWLMECFGPEISADKLERADRFIEEALELLQSGDYPKERVYSLIEYVYGREKGEPAQEVGGVMTTLAAYCLAHGMDMHEEAEKELARVWTKVDKIRAKQAAKPHGSALPIALESAPEAGE